MYSIDHVHAQRGPRRRSPPSGDFCYPSFIPCADPLLTAQEQATICSTANRTAQGNPFETFNGVNYPGLNIYILRRNVEGGPRILDAINTSAREVIGLKGDFGSDAWTYNVYAQHGTVDNSDANLNYLGNSQMQEALNVLPGATGPVCGGPTGTAGALVGSGGVGFTTDPTCVPWNMWKANGVTPQALAFMSVPLHPTRAA